MSQRIPSFREIQEAIALLNVQLPNASDSLLWALRELQARRDNVGALPEHEARLFGTAFEQLDECLRNGGELPVAWQRPQPERDTLPDITHRATCKRCGAFELPDGHYCTGVF